MTLDPTTIKKLLAGMRKTNASDLHIKVGVPPTYRINGILRPILPTALTEDQADHILDAVIPRASRNATKPAATSTLPCTTSRVTVSE